MEMQIPTYGCCCRSKTSGLPSSSEQQQQQQQRSRRRRGRGSGPGPSMQYQNGCSRRKILMMILPPLILAMQVLLLILLITTTVNLSVGSLQKQQSCHLSSLLFAHAFTTIPSPKLPPPPPPQRQSWRWFGRRSRSRPATITAKQSKFQLYYAYNDSVGNDDDDNKKDDRASSSSREIPIIGPLLFRSKPLLVGESMILKPPITPLQWYTIQECVHAQHDALEIAESSSSESPTPTSTSYVTIDEAPIVAIFHQGSTDYATLAAIVGISSTSSGNSKSNSYSKKSPTTFGGAFDDLGGDDDDHDHDFQTKISRLALDYMNTRYYNDKSQVRLVGIGRVKLSYITTKNLEIHPPDTDTDIDEEDGSDDNHDDDRKEPIVVAQKVELLWDDSTHDGEKSKASSPVHSISKLGSQVSRIRFLHTQRQSLTKQLVMAQTRLDMASRSWEDHDGIGSISNSSFQFQDTISSSTSSDSSFEESTAQATISSEVPFTSQASSTNSENVSLTTTLPSSTALRCLNELENYGLGFTQSAVVDLNAMTEVLISDILRPYFSPNILKTEEFYYEAFSWVALSSVALYCTKDELEDAMFRSTRTSERFDIIYHAQTRHKQDLTELAQRREQELLDCGEECTDIF